MRFSGNDGVLLTGKQHTWMALSQMVASGWSMEHGKHRTGETPDSH